MAHGRVMARTDTFPCNAQATCNAQFQRVSNPWAMLSKHTVLLITTCPPD
jgi:hypothetical protein